MSDSGRNRSCVEISEVLRGVMHMSNFIAVKKDQYTFTEPLGDHHETAMVLTVSNGNTELFKVVISKIEEDHNERE